MKEKEIEKIKQLLKEMPYQAKRQAEAIEKIIADSELEDVLQEKWHLAETITEKGVYEKLKYRTIESFGFYLRAFQSHFTPCKDCQRKLKSIILNKPWYFGNKSYEPAIELNRNFDEIDEDSYQTLETHKATEKELKRIGMEGWEKLE